MRFRVWASAIAIIVLPLEGALLAMNWGPSCPAGERIRMPMPFEHNGGQSWYTMIPELEHVSDTVIENPNTSPLVICEGTRLLGPARSVHKDIWETGRGQYSHWGPYLIFSTSDNSDPNENGRSYLAVKTTNTPIGGSPVPVQQVTIANKVLVDRNGMTLYTFDRDSVGKSTCNGACAETWPPYTYWTEGHDPSVPGRWSLVTRDDGTKMWAHDGKPLYYFKGDKIRGEANGNGTDGVWHTAHSP